MTTYDTREALSRWHAARAALNGAPDDDALRDDAAQAGDAVQSAALAVLDELRAVHARLVALCARSRDSVDALAALAEADAEDATRRATHPGDDVGVEYDLTQRRDALETAQESLERAAASLEEGIALLEG